jgi:predicted MFS family arabinose efflux permease
MFGRPEFTFTCASSGLRMFVVVGSTFAISLFLQEEQGLSPSRAGTLLLPSYVLLFLGTLLGGRLSDHRGSGKPASLGMGMDMAAMLLLGLLRKDTPQWYPTLAMGIHGLGAGLALAPYSRTVATTFAGAQMGLASGLYSMMRFAGVAFGAAITGSFLETRLGLHGAGYAATAYRETFTILAGIALLSALTAALAKPKRPHREHPEV